MRARVGALSLAILVTGCGTSGSPEKTGTETFGCYVGSCVSPGVTGDDDDGGGTSEDAGALDASDAG